MKILVALSMSQDEAAAGATVTVKSKNGDVAVLSPTAAQTHVEVSDGDEITIGKVAEPPAA